LYEIGAGVLKDHVQAYKWYLLASGEGYTKAGGSLKKLAENMTPSEIEEANRLAKEWQPVSTPGI
jgi:TPR repeat protein